MFDGTDQYNRVQFLTYSHNSIHCQAWIRITEDLLQGFLIITMISKNHDLGWWELTNIPTEIVA